MDLPTDLDTKGVDVEADLSLLDEKILAILRESESPVLTSKEIHAEGIRKSRRTVHNHLDELDELGLVSHKRTTGDKDNGKGAKLWWIPDDRIQSDTPDPETVTEGLDQLGPEGRQSLKAEFPELAVEKPIQYRRGVQITMGGVVFALLFGVFELLRLELSIQALPNFTPFIYIGGLMVLVGFAAYLDYLFVLAESRTREVAPLSPTVPKLLNLQRYGFVSGIGLFIMSLALESVGYPFQVVSEWLMLASLVAAFILLPVLAVVTLAKIATHGPGMLTHSSSP